MPKFPFTNREHTGEDPEVIRYYENDTQTTTFLFDTFTSLLSWANRYNEKRLTVYIRSDAGLIRAVYLTNKLAEYLRSQGHKVDVMHLELSRTKK